MKMRKMRKNSMYYIKLDDMFINLKNVDFVEFLDSDFQNKN